MYSTLFTVGKELSYTCRPQTIYTSLGHKVTVWRKDMAYIISDIKKRSVFYLFRSEEDAYANIKAGGTGFDGD